MDAEICIVCMHNLEPLVDSPTADLEAGSPDETGAVHIAAESLKIKDEDGLPVEVQTLACVQPCGHVMHNECLKPWVEHANRCPLCRARFNLVEVKDEMTGPVVSTYSVVDKDFVPDIDPAMYADELLDEEQDGRPCPLCGCDEDEDVLLLCDGCSVGYHLYCVELEDIPVAPWFCMECEEQEAIDAVEVPGVTRHVAHHLPDRRTRAQVRNLRRPDQSWGRVWQSVWDNLNLDLDSPFDDDLQLEQYRDARQSGLRSRRDFLAWQHRNEIVRRQGGNGSVFQRNRSALLRERFAPAPEAPTPEKAHEQRVEERAWRAMDKARDTEAEASSSQNGRGKRKRKSPTASPSEQTPAEPERKLKRPNTRRPLDKIAPRVNASSPESSASTHRLIDPAPEREEHPPATRADPSTAPSFLQSLLSEVEASEAGVSSIIHIDKTESQNGVEHGSPGASPTASNFSTPRALSNTPPPRASSRPGSPTPFSFTSRVEPDFPLLRYSSDKPPVSTCTGSDVIPVGRPGSYAPAEHESRVSRSEVQTPSGRRPSSSDEASPLRMTMSLEAKNVVRDLVKRILKPMYAQKRIDEVQYTHINRAVCHKLYERIDDASKLTDDAKTHWETVAAQEVNEALNESSRARRCDNNLASCDGD